MDLRNAFEEIADVPAAPSSDQVEADLTRGRRALRRRRAGQSAAAGAFAVAAAVAAISFGVHSDNAGGTGGTTVAERPTVVAAKLVAYKGAQPKGFTIDTVPDGWFIQADNDSSLLLAPASAKNPGPDVDPSTNPEFDESSFVGKIAIMLESKDQHGPEGGTAVKVGDAQGKLVKSPPGETPAGQAPTPADGDTGWTLWVQQPSGIYLLVQFWEGLGLSQNQMTELGAGVHVHKGAVQGVG